MTLRMRRIYRRPGFLLKRCHQVAAAIFLDRCSGCGITPSQYSALSALREYPGIDQLAVGGLIGLDRSTAGLVIKLLAERGLLERSKSSRDQRRMHLRLTAAGQSLLLRADKAARRAQKDVLAALPPAKRPQFLAFLEEFLRGHEALIQPADVMAGKPFGSQFDKLIETKPVRRESATPSGRVGRGPYPEKPVPAPKLPRRG